MNTRIKEAINYWNKQDESIRPLAFNQAKIAEIITLLKGKAKKEAEEYYATIKSEPEQPENFDVNDEPYWS